MKKIDLIELMDENNTKPKDQGETWADVLENIKRESNNFDLETMCNICIKQQYELGIKDKDGNLMTPIECTGLQTFKNKIETEHSSEVYDEIKEMLSAEELSLAEQTVNSMTWMEHTIKDEKLFSPRPYQILINSCSAKKKVLRMGRRCLEENEKVVGVKKSYRAKHLWHLFKSYKKMPEIVSYDDETGELVRTDQYLIMPNGIELVYKVTTETGHTTSATLKHPLFVFSKSGKQFEYKEIGDIDIENDQILFLDNKLHNIKSITKVGMRQTYHISVVKYETFATGAGFLHHNTGKTFAMSVGLLHRLLVNKGYRVLMVAPMETMITEVVEQIKKFCAAMEEDPIIAATQSPIHQLTFNTGSTFKGVTAGASGAKGTRGKGADLLYVDECFPAKTKIKLHDGSVKNIEEIEVGDKVLSFDEKKGKLVSKPVVAVKCTGKKEVFSFTTVSGKKIHCTAEHPVLTRSGWMAAHEANSIATTETRSGEYFFESIIGCKLKSVEPVYNLEVKDTHTYVADGFIVHNCDFLRPKDLNSILGILLDSKNTEFWASSTPIGETNLYKLSQDPSFKEFHYPSFVIPHYSDEMDAVLRAQMDEAGYIQEVKAEFGADNDSVYPINFIEQAIVREEVIINAEYVSRNRRDFIVVMGVDWNHDKVGTRIVILAYHKLSGRYFTIVKEKVSKANWTQILAVEKIVDLNRMYEIDHIYVDEGFGITQASQLRLFSQSQYGKVPPNHPDLKLSKVVSVNFSASITLRDPISGDEYRKQTKQYMIEHSVDLLTRGLIVLQEKEDADIIAQMKNYIIKTKTVSGLKTYTYRDAQVADHDLDAFNIALHGFHTEYSEFVSTSPLVGLNTILKEGSSLPDESSIISYGSNMIINTKKSLITSKFRQDRSNREFKTRKRW